METKQKFYVYVDFREDDGKPFYVGKGNERRVKDTERNSLHTKIKNKHGMIRKILFETLCEQEAFEKEAQLIQELKTYIDFGEGGSNFTLGGDGIAGYKFTDEQNKNKSESLIESYKNNPELGKNHSKRLKKIWDDPVRKEEMLSIFNDPEHRKKRSEISKKTWENPEHQNLVSESMKKVWENPEYKEKIGNAVKQHHSDPEFRKKQGEKMKEILSDPKTREKISKNTKEKLSDPEIRKKMIENTRLAISKHTPEQRSEKSRKGWETRRLKKLQLQKI